MTSQEVATTTMVADLLTGTYTLGALAVWCVQVKAMEAGGEPISEGEATAMKALRAELESTKLELQQTKAELTALRESVEPLKTLETKLEQVMYIFALARKLYEPPSSSAACSTPPACTHTPPQRVVRRVVAKKCATRASGDAAGRSVPQPPVAQANGCCGHPPPEPPAQREATEDVFSSATASLASACRQGPTSPVAHEETKCGSPFKPASPSSSPTHRAASSPASFDSASSKSLKSKRRDEGTPPQPLPAAIVRVGAPSSFNKMPPPYTPPPHPDKPTLTSGGQKQQKQLPEGVGAGGRGKARQTETKSVVEPSSASQHAKAPSTSVDGSGNGSSKASRAHSYKSVPQWTPNGVNKEGGAPEGQGQEGSSVTAVLHSSTIASSGGPTKGCGGFAVADDGAPSGCGNTAESVFNASSCKDGSTAIPTGANVKPFVFGCATGGAGRSSRGHSDAAEQGSVMRRVTEQAKGGREPIVMETAVAVK